VEPCTAVLNTQLQAATEAQGWLQTQQGQRQFISLYLGDEATQTTRTNFSECTLNLPTSPRGLSVEFKYTLYIVKLSRYTPWRRLGGKGGIAPTLFFCLGIRWGEWSASRPGRALPSGKGPRYTLDRRLGGPQCRLGRRDWNKNPLPY
jgi:hypothetical protein